MTLSSWQEKAAAKAATTYSKIPQAWRLEQKDLNQAKQQVQLTGPFIQSFLGEKEKEIINHDTTVLAKKLASREYSAAQVTEAYCKTAAVAHQINNCLHEILFEQARERARYLDEYIGSHRKPLGPLHGVPVSLKDQFHVKGCDTTMGYIGWIGTFEGDNDPSKVRKVESQVVKELLSQGAVLYCKTSLPQTLMYGETINNIIGCTLNPVNQRLSCGGSSGGEAALQALGGSSVGFGTDIGGSVRIPAAFCGTYSIKPSWSRLSYRNVANCNPGQILYASAVGIMATSLETLPFMMKVLLDTEPWRRDPEVVPIPWRPEVEQEVLQRGRLTAAEGDRRPLKLAICWSDNYMSPHPPVTRGLKIVYEALKGIGYKAIDWNPPSHQALSQLHLDIIISDGGHDVNKQLDLSGEPIIPPIRETFKLREPFTAIKCQELAIQGLELCRAYSDYWESTANDDGQVVDAVIMPAAPHAAVIPGKYFYTGYTEVFNTVDYSSAVFPVTKADKAVDIADPNYKPFNEVDQKNWEAYDPEVYHGAPVGLQVVARRYEEEKVLAIARIIDQVLKKNNTTL
ncbi:hypothetical protein AJ80_03810 [Polytolypa hystricis UAMH7299]|uniref:Amidase domain-containing protein n=1 Tax=Polytolypa hystricis (strain UAMH7299) TaxID=1447883 RepID=A0A2B7YEF4_POLH7|nr:hypothetical protein AJ80_03810 [Polytolypa hystricis UAMH7299]